jgi:hypothetical protein
LTVDGTIFIDGNLFVHSNDEMQYSGNGTIYFQGTVDLRGIICGPGSSFNASTGACGMTWDPAAGALLLVAANAGVPTVSTVYQPPVYPTSDGSVSDWTKSTGTQAWSLLDDPALDPTVPTVGSDRVTSQTDEQMQDLRLPNTLTYSPAATYQLKIHGSGGTRRALDLQVSYDGGATWQPRVADVIGQGAAAGWRTVSLAPATTSGLNNLQVRLICNRIMGGGSPTDVAVNAVYFQASGPTLTYPTAPVQVPAFNVTSGAKLEAGAWTVGDFESLGGAETGGSVFASDGAVKINGGGALKAFVTLPSGTPSLYDLAETASDFG